MSRQPLCALTNAKVGGTAIIYAVLECDLFFKEGLELVDRNTYLFHSISVADCDAVICGSLVVTDRLEIHCDAEGSTDLVLTAISLANGTGVPPLPRHKPR